MNPDQLLLIVLAARLTPLQVDVFIDHELLGRTLISIASELGVSHSAPRQCLARAQRKMQRVVMAEAA